MKCILQINPKNFTEWEEADKYRTSRTPWKIVNSRIEIKINFPNLPPIRSKIEIEMEEYLLCSLNNSSSHYEQLKNIDLVVYGYSYFCFSEDEIISTIKVKQQ